MLLLNHSFTSNKYFFLIYFQTSVHHPHCANSFFHTSFSTTVGAARGAIAVRCRFRGDAPVGATTSTSLSSAIFSVAQHVAACDTLRANGYVILPCLHAPRFRTASTIQNLHNCSCCMLVSPISRQASLSSYVSKTTPSIHTDPIEHFPLSFLSPHANPSTFPIKLMITQHLASQPPITIRPHDVSPWCAAPLEPTKLIA